MRGTRTVREPQSRPSAPSAGRTLLHANKVHIHSHHPRYRATSFMSSKLSAQLFVRFFQLLSTINPLPLSVAPSERRSKRRECIFRGTMWSATLLFLMLATEVSVAHAFESRSLQEAREEREKHAEKFECLARGNPRCFRRPWRSLTCADTSIVFCCERDLVTR